MATPTTCTVEPNLTECAVCHDTFTVPKILPCGHLLCRDCLVTWLQTQPQALCPLCRCIIVDLIQQGGRSVEELADDLPTDLAMRAMVEAETLLSKQHVCCVCDDVAAVALCLQCGDMFCQQCCKMHKKQSATKHHQVEKLSSLTTERLATHHPATCPDHKDKVCELYCPTHDSSLCVLCVCSVHRNCTGLVNFQSQVGELTAELAQLKNKLTEGAVKAEEYICLLDKHVEELKKESQASLDEIKNVCDRLKAAIDARLLELQSMTFELVSDKIARVNNVKQLLVQKLSKIITHKSVADFYQNFNEHSYFKDMVNLVKGRILIHDLEMTESLPTDLQQNKSFLINVNHKAVIDIEQKLSQLGEIALNQGNNIFKASAKTRLVVNTDTSPAPSWSIKFDPMTATAACDLKIEISTKEAVKRPGIQGLATCPPYDEIYIADYSNQIISVFSVNSNSLISALRLEVKPYRITLVGDDLLAVTSRSDVITLIDITDKQRTQVKETITTTRQYTGMAVLPQSSDDTTLVVSCFKDDAGPASVDLVPDHSER